MENKTLSYKINFLCFKLQNIVHIGTTISISTILMILFNVQVGDDINDAI